MGFLVAAETISNCRHEPEGTVLTSCFSLAAEIEGLEFSGDDTGIGDERFEVDWLGDMGACRAKFDLGRFKVLPVFSVQRIACDSQPTYLASSGCITTLLLSMTLRDHSMSTLR